MPERDKCERKKNNENKQKTESKRTGKKMKDNKSMNLFCGCHGVMKAIY